MLHVSAPAKINLFLEITGKRRDGYHTLATVFQAISLADTLTFRSSDTLSLKCSDSILPTDDQNIVMRAAKELRRCVGGSQGAKIYLEKKIPTGAGLGGGSSDAAAVLMTLPKLWKRRAPRRLLERLASNLGADVPFFLRKGLCSATGIGDRLKTLPKIPKTWIVLVYPDFGVSTKEAYARVSLPFESHRSIRPFITSLTSKKYRLELFNRFESLVFPQHPQLPTIKQQLIAAGADSALMSGSGSSVYGLVASRHKGENVLKQIRKAYPQSWLVHTL